MISADSLNKLEMGTTHCRILFALNCLSLSITHFCKISFSYLFKYINDDNMFVNEYVKRYKSFVDTAIYMNDYLENLNVIVNYVYDILWKGFPSFPKFSILRFMV